MDAFRPLAGLILGTVRGISKEVILGEHFEPVSFDRMPDVSKPIEEVMIHLDFEPLEEGGFVATSPDVPGLVAQGRTMAEVIEIARDVARKIVESCLEHGNPLPEVFRKRPERMMS